MKIINDIINSRIAPIKEDFMKKAAIFLISVFSVFIFSLVCSAESVPYYDFENCGPDYAYDSLIFYFADSNTGTDKTMERLAWSITDTDPISGKKSLMYDNSINNSTTLLLANMNMYDCSSFEKVSIKLRNTDKNYPVLFNFFIDQPALTSAENFTVRFTMTLQDSMVVTDKNGETVTPVISSGFLRVPPDETYTVTLSLKDGFFGRSYDPTLTYDAPNDFKLVSYWGFFIYLQGNKLEGNFLIDDICMISEGSVPSPSLREWEPIPVPSAKHQPEVLYGLNTQYPAKPEVSFGAHGNLPAPSAVNTTVFGSSSTAVLIISCIMLVIAAVIISVLFIKRKQYDSQEVKTEGKGGSGNEE